MVAVVRGAGGGRLRGAPAAPDAGPTAGPAGVRRGDLLVERELWRVEAGRGAGPPAGSDDGRDGVFDLSFDWSDGRWQLVGCAD